MTVLHPKIAVFIDALETHHRATREVQVCEDLHDTDVGRYSKSIAATLLGRARSDLEDALLEMLDDRINR